MNNTQTMQDGTEIIERDLGTTGMQQMAGGQFAELIRVAHEYPRNIDRFKQNAIALGCNDVDTAASCFYAVPRAGTTLTGPSVKFAQIIAGTWGNIWVQCTPISQDSRFVTVRATAWDLETNVCISFDVKRKITTQSGSTYSDDMIAVTTTAAASIAYRNAVLRLVPEPFTKEIERAVRDVIRGDATTLDERRERMLQWFNAQGVDSARILHTIGVGSIAQIGLDELETLHGVAQAFNDGMSMDTLVPRVYSGGEGEPDNRSQLDKLRDRLQDRTEQPTDGEQGGDGDSTPAPSAEQDGEDQDDAPDAADDQDTEAAEVDQDDPDAEDPEITHDDLVDAGLR